MEDNDTGIDGVRRRNLSRLLRLVHVEGPLARSALTSRTGLNRSTTADLVAELSSLGLVEEHAPDPSRRVGRPSPLVAVSPRVVTVAVHPEVDALTLAAVGLDRHVRVRTRIETPALLTPERTAALVADHVAAWRDGPLRDHRIAAIGVAVPGLVRAEDGLVRDAPHLGWHEIPLRDLLAEATGLPVAVGNDASLGALAEHLFGAGRGIDHLVYLNGGASGIGGGLIVGGAPLGGAGGYAGEFGQNRPGILDDDDRRAADGVLEDEVARSRLLDALGRDSADEPTLADALADASAREQGTGPVQAELSRQRRILATALANAVNVLNPAVVVLGGFLATLAANDPDDLLDRVRRQSMSANAETLDIRVAVLAEDRLLIGAAELALGPLLHSPAGTPLS